MPARRLEGIHPASSALSEVEGGGVLGRGNEFPERPVTSLLRGVEPSRPVDAIALAIRGSPEHLEGLADVKGRADDGLWMASLAARGMAIRRAASADLLGILPCGAERRQKTTRRIGIGPGEAGERVVTIGFPSGF